MRWKLPLLAGLAVFGIAPGGYAQAPVEQARIPQQVVINGQPANAVYVIAGGGAIQSYTCSTPQAYTTADGATRGWACYEPTSGVWLLGALPQQPPQTAQQVPAPQTLPAPAPQVIAPPAQYAPQVITPPAQTYAPAPQIVYVTPQPQVVYVAAPPPVFYSTVYPAVYPAAVYPVPQTVVLRPRPVYSGSAIVGAATIEAAGRIAAATIVRSRPAVQIIDVGGRDHHRHRY
ncbi:MAG TPA: hypothetical protein VFY29_15320 [Terriglobia bacterium]|nr:hypothetical protein [Terriglobia bacterium]